MPDVPASGPEPMRRPEQGQAAARGGERGGPSTLPPSMARVQRLNAAVGNRRFASDLEKARAGDALTVQRVAVKKDYGGETIYENPNMSPGGVPIASPTAAQKQFVATGYILKANYDMTRGGAVDVKVRIQFVDQKRGESEWMTDPATGKVLTDASGNKVPDPNYRRNVGEIGEIKDAARKDFATAQCASIGSSWNRYDLVGKEEKARWFGIVQPKKGEIRLPLRFTAVPVFDPNAKDVHTTIRLFGMGTEAKRSGAHPIDAGHWYMDYKKNYGSMDINAISAHEFGHLLGLPDEYSISNDQAHQLLHKMGGGAATADKELDQFTVRQMVANALAGPLVTRLNANLPKVSENIAKAKDSLRRQLAGAVTKAWGDATIRATMTKDIVTALNTPLTKGGAPTKRSWGENTVREAVRFETGKNLSNATMAKAGVANFTAAGIEAAIEAEYKAWMNGLLRATFKTTTSEGTNVSFSASYSANVTGAGGGANAAATSGIVDTYMGAAGVPKVGPSDSLISALEALPATWKSPGNGIAKVYDAAFVDKYMRLAVATAQAAQIFPKVKSVGELYQKVLGLVQSGADASTKAVASAFIDANIKPKVRDQLAVLKAKIDNEVDAAMGMKAGALAAKSADPNLKKLAEHLYGMIQAQQNAKTWDTKGGLLNPGSGSAGIDVRYTSSSIMGPNNATKSGFRADMIQPVVDQFNTRLKHSYESDFKAEVKR